MEILVVTPSPPGACTGNRVTAERWAGLLTELGHRVTVATEYSGNHCDMMIALHARRSFPAMTALRQRRPTVPLVLALTGTDLYGDIRTDADARAALGMASRLVLLQERGLAGLPDDQAREKARVIPQSVVAPAGDHLPSETGFEVCVLANLRPVKDPLRTALAVADLPSSSRIRVVHLGMALDESLAADAREQTSANPRYQWLGARPRQEALETLARCRLMVLSSLSEGGANVVSEAIVCGTPVISSRIAGSIGMLGDDYPGYFPAKDTAALRALLLRAESDPGFLDDLTRRCNELRPVYLPDREREAWRLLIGNLPD